MIKTEHFEQTNHILSADRITLTFKNFDKWSPKMWNGGYCLYMLLDGVPFSQVPKVQFPAKPTIAKCQRFST